MIQSNASTLAAVAMTPRTTQSCQLSGGIMALPLHWDARRLRISVPRRGETQTHSEPKNLIAGPDNDLKPLVG